MNNPNLRTTKLGSTRCDDHPFVHLHAGPFSRQTCSCFFDIDLHHQHLSHSRMSLKTRQETTWYVGRYDVTMIPEL